MSITEEFEDLYRAEKAGVARRVAKRLRPSDDQEAAVSDAFTQLYEAMTAGKASDPRALLYTIADRAALKTARQREYAEDMIERLGVSDSRIREQQALYAHKQRNTYGWSDEDEGNNYFSSWGSL